MRRVVIGGAAVVFAALVLLNLLGYSRGRAFTRFATGGARASARPVTALQKVRIVLVGPRIPRPENRRTPEDLELSFERHEFPGHRGLALEAWLIPAPGCRARVVMFHAFPLSKESLLVTASAFRDLGLCPLLVDFYGYGGSEGSTTSIGFHEGDDVAAAYRYARALPGELPIVLYGDSMGAAAVLRGVARHGIEPEAVILECPFDRLLTTVEHRFGWMGAPAPLVARLVLFWGGVQQGFDALGFSTAEDATAARMPTLLMQGDADPWVTVEESRSIFHNLGGSKRMVVFTGAGHESFLEFDGARWRGEVARFLEESLQSSLDDATSADSGDRSQ